MTQKIICLDFNESLGRAVPTPSPYPRRNGVISDINVPYNALIINFVFCPNSSHNHVDFTVSVAICYA